MTNYERFVKTLEIKKLTEIKMPDGKSKKDAKCFLNPIVFFVTDKEKR